MVRLKRRLGVVAVALAVALVATFLSDRSAARGASSRGAPVGIVDLFSVEQAPVLAEMHVTGKRAIDGWTFWEGTIGGVPVVDVMSGEINEAAELATYVLDKTFHPRATLLSGTAGSVSPRIRMGDVLLSGFVDDKTAVHYYPGGYQTTYGGAEVPLTSHSDIRGAVASYQEVTPATPSDAGSYGYGPKRTDKSLAMVSSFAAPKQLVNLGLKASSMVGTTPVWDATTGVEPAAGAPAGPSITNEAVAGVVGATDVWTTPLAYIEAQNALYPNDAEENEGTGFAFTNAQLGVPWLLVRGISNTVWYPNAYDGVLASKHAAIVVKYIVEHLPARLSPAPETISDLSPESNARRYGYLVASKAYYKSVGPVTKIVVNKKTITGAKLNNLNSAYVPSAGAVTASRGR
jgi:adenosylhomocysteine nucleosidase